jgi:DNA-binding response OmpR family regulator
MRLTSIAQKVVRLLYVDDEPDILNVVQKGLQRHGFSVDIVSNPEEILAMKDLSEYDMIVLDLRMPNIDGFMLYSMIKDRISSSKTKMCFFTAFTSYLDTYNQMFPTWSGPCFLTKPMSIRQLADNLHKLLSVN